MRDLLAFAQVDIKECPVCTLDPGLREEVEAGRRQGVRFVTISRWLAQEHATDCNEEYVRSHFRRNHHVNAR